MPFALFSFVLTALIWPVAALISVNGLSFLSIEPGTNLINLQAGFRLLILLIFRWPGAVGISLAHALVVLSLYDNPAVAFVMEQSLMAGVGSMIIFESARGVLGISKNLLDLQPLHLPSLGLLVIGPLAAIQGIALAEFGVKDPGSLATFIPHKLMGDLAGVLTLFLAVGVVAHLISHRRGDGA